MKKKTFSNFGTVIRMLMIATVVVALESCGGGSVSSRIDEVVSDDVDVVIAGDVKHCFDELDIKVKGGTAVLPGYMTDYFNAANPHGEIKIYDVLNRIKGLEYNSLVIAGKIHGRDRMDFIISFGIDDVDTFVQSMNAESELVEVGETAGFTTIGNTFGQLLVDGKNAYCLVNERGMLSGVEAVSTLETFRKEAKDRPLAAWKKKYLTKESIGSAWMSNTLVRNLMDESDYKVLQTQLRVIPGVVFDNLSMGMRLNIDGDKATANLTLFNGEKEMDTPFGKDIDMTLLTFVEADDMMVMAAGVNETTVNLLRVTVNKTIDSQMDYYKTELAGALGDGGDDPYGYNFYLSPDFYRRQLRSLTMTRQLLNEIADNTSGSVLYATGRNSDKLDEESSREWDGTRMLLAFSCKEGTAADVAQKLYEGLNVVIGEDKVTVSRTSNGFEIVSNDNLNKIYVVVSGDNIAIANHPVKTDGPANFDKDVFKGNWLACQVVVPGDTRLPGFTSLPGTVEATFETDDMELDAELKIKGAKTNIVNAIMTWATQNMDEL